MWQHEFVHETNLTPETIWPVLAGVADWAEVDHNIERIEIDTPPGPGVQFRLKPKGGPMLRFVIGAFEPPTTYSDVCLMPLARMETRHGLIPGPKTTMRVRITITGPLAWFWGWAVGRKHAAGLPAQTERILAAAWNGGRKRA